MEEISVLDAVYWIYRASKSIHPETVKKCFVKAGFPCIEHFNEDADTAKTVEEIANLCRRGDVSLEVDSLISFDNELSTEEGLHRATEIVPKELNDGAEEDEDGENSETNEDKKEIKIESFSEALSAVDDLQEFAAFKNCKKLMEVIQDVKDLLQKSAYMPICIDMPSDRYVD
ncbi:hypothetical protein LSTR_LSTR013115 [Laodelphax striatellus]|uniref:Uncharacterized protein n=1 Tax=Laodelphax striatellus TaxID=195883 RepID=A0A482WGX3_LAOST|nr:hypothetical protein LSTR_LSTR013115 [Laodelphax striatellus]